MSDKKTQVLKPELFVNESIFYSPTVTLEPAVIINAVEQSNLIPFAKKVIIANVAIGLIVDNAIRVTAFISEIKELFADDPEIYNVVINIIISITNR